MGARVHAKLLTQFAMNEADHPTVIDMTAQVSATQIREVRQDRGLTPQDPKRMCDHGTATRHPPPRP
jgi:hypothetical protein